MLRKQVPMKSSRFSLSLKREERMGEKRGKEGKKEVGEKENKGRRINKNGRLLFRRVCSYLSFTWKRRRSHIEGNCRQNKHTIP